MHPKNVYKDSISFSQLAKDYPNFAKCMKGPNSIDFHDPESIRQLAKALLKRDFKLEIELPEDRLCPAIPNRLNYILWLSDLITDTHEPSQNTTPSIAKVMGLDIGTGASAIYPLLGTAQFHHWNFLATDIDPKSLSVAANNISQNVLEDRITLIDSSTSDNIFSSEISDFDGIIDFSMCNPPFYTSVNDMMSSAKKKAVPPLSACTGSTGEMVTEGGEVAFVGKMIDESLILKTKIRWYTSMLGKRSSVEELVKKLRENDISNIVVGELVQGVGKTKRWVIGWSFMDTRAGDHISRQPSSRLLKSFLPFPTTFKIPLPTDVALTALLPQVEEIVKTACSSFPSDSFEWTSVRLSYFTTMYDVVENLYSNGRGLTNGDTWSRAARRRAKAQAVSGANASVDQADIKKFGFAVGIFIGATTVGTGSSNQPSRLHVSGDGGEDEDKDMDEADAWDHDYISLPASSVEPEAAKGSFILLRWTRGLDHVLWESFCGMLRRKIVEKLGEVKT